MISYNRDLLDIPEKLADDEYKKRIYNDLYNADNKIKARWNTMQENGHKIIREYLWKLSDGCCAYCGKKLSNYSDMDVDHFLPSSKFPYLAYCLDNLIPSCKTCNQTYKHDFVPKELQDMKVVEPCLSEIEDYDVIYNKKTVLNELSASTRIVDPTFDNTEEHLNFNAEFFMYETKTKIGENTNEMFFDKSEFVSLLEKMSNIVRLIVKGSGEDSYEIIKGIIDIEGYEFYYNKFYEYWMNEKCHNRI